MGRSSGRNGYVVQYVKEKGSWQVAKPTGSVLRKFDKKQSAVNHATKTAKNNKPAFVTIYKKSGGEQKTKKYDGKAGSSSKSSSKSGSSGGISSLFGL